MGNIFLDIIKTFDALEKIDESKAIWRTVKGHHIALNKNGEIVAGGVPGTDLDKGNKVDSSKKESGSNYKYEKSLKKGHKGGNLLNLLDQKEVLSNPKNHSIGKSLIKTDKGLRINPERKKLYKKIVNDFLSGVKETDNPVVYFNGGGSAAGKGSISKFIEDYPTMKNKTGVVVDPDELKRKMPEWDDNDPKSAPFTHEESSMLSKYLFDQALQAGKYDVLMDGTLAGSAQKVRKKVENAKKYGYPVKANYVTTDLREAIKRNYFRYLRSGRLPSVDVLISTHQAVSKNFEDVYDAFDGGNLIDNNGKEPEIIATFENGKLDIKNPEKYKKFIAKKDEDPEELKKYFRDNIAEFEKEWLLKNPNEKLRKRPEIK